MLMAICLLIPLGCEDYLEEDFRSGLSPATFYNSDSEAIIAVNGAYAMF